MSAGAKGMSWREQQNDVLSCRELTKFLPPSCDAADDYDGEVWTIASRNCCLHLASNWLTGQKFRRERRLICHHRLLTGMLPVGRQPLIYCLFKSFSTQALAWPSVVLLDNNTRNRCEHTIRCSSSLARISDEKVPP